MQHPGKQARGNKEMARVTLRVPTPLQVHCDGKRQMEMEARSVRELLDRVGEIHDALARCVVTRDGQLRPHVNVFVRRRDIRELNGLDTELTDGDEVIVMPSVAGG